MAHSLDDGIAALRAGDFPRAAELLREAADADAGDVKARMALGAALSEMGRWDEAVAALREATALSPRSAPAHYNLGSALERAGRTEEARNAYREAVRIDPLHDRAGAALRRLVDTPMVDQNAWPTIETGAPAPATGGFVPGRPTPARGAPAPAARPYSPLGPGGSGIPANVAAPPPAALKIDAPVVAAHAAPTAPTSAAPVPEFRVGPPVPLTDGPGGAPPASPPPVARPAAPSHYADSRLPSFSAVLIWLVVLGIVGAFGYNIYKRFTGGVLEQDAAVLADHAIRQAYIDLQRGVTIPDAHYLAPYTPNMHKRGLTEVDITRKNDQLRPMQIHCEIDVEKVVPKLSDKGHVLPTVDEVTAVVKVRWRQGNGPEQVSEGTQVWHRKNGKWTPNSWRLFGNLPLSFERWAGDDQIVD